MGSDISITLRKNCDRVFFHDCFYRGSPLYQIILNGFLGSLNGGIPSGDPESDHYDTELREYFAREISGYGPFDKEVSPGSINIKWR